MIIRSQLFVWILTLLSGHQLYSLAVALKRKFMKLYYIDLSSIINLIVEILIYIFLHKLISGLSGGDEIFENSQNHWIIHINFSISITLNSLINQKSNSTIKSHPIYFHYLM